MKYILTVDCGTQSSRAFVWDAQGNPISEGRAEFQIITPRLGWYEEDADTWWPATCTAIRTAIHDIDVREIAALGITHQRETFVPIDENGTPLRNALLHMDQRCEDQVDFIKNKIGAKEFHAVTGKYPHFIYSLGDILWIIENEPHIAERVYKYLDVQGFLMMHLIDRCITSYVSADTTALINIRKKGWDRDIMRSLGLKEEQFPELCPPGQLIGNVTGKAAEQTGLPEGLPVIAGAGDGICTALGTNTTNKHRLCLMIGTWTVLSAFSPEYAIDMSFRTLYSAIEGAYNVEANVAGGFIISWFLENFENREDNSSSEAFWERLASDIKPGSEGLITVPYWLGCLSPFWDPATRGLTLGWSGIHKAAHFYRSILEGIAFEHRMIAEAFSTALGTEFQNLVFVGGGAKSPLWGQIVSDVFNIPLYISQTVESTSLGAAVLTAYGTGLYPSIREAAENMTRIEKRYEPDERNAALYHRLYNEVYRDLFSQVRKSMNALGAIIR
jgi:xylulokinase